MTAHELKVKRLQDGESFITSEKGNSMVPLIFSGQKHRLSPVEVWDDVHPGEIVFCKVKGRYLTHMVYAKNSDRGVLIGNNKGRMNGWTRTVYGRVVEVLK